MKKLLLVGFILAGVFITYSLSTIYASIDVHDEDFINSNREYIAVDMPKVEVDRYLEYEEMPEVDRFIKISEYGNLDKLLEEVKVKQ